MPGSATVQRTRRRPAIVLAVLAVGAFALGLLLKDQADFSRDYLRSQLDQRGIVFTPVDALLPAQRDVPCLVDNAGQPMTTGKQAECYAKYQIGIDLTMVDNGHTYFESHYNGYLARVKADEALRTKPDDPATQELVKQADVATRKADDLLAGEATRGLLLTAYGFSVIGDRLAQAATASFAVSGLLLVAAVVLFVRSRRPAEPTASVEAVAAPAPPTPVEAPAAV
jgi:hypothetical protein